MSNLKNIIFDVLEKQSYPLNEKMIFQFCKYADLLISWNKKMNLTSIIEPREIAIKHFVDSISVLQHINFADNCKVIDIGTGAGFPGVPLKIVRPDINLTLMDSLNKRLVFLEDVLTNLNIDATLVHARAENFAHDNVYREKYDFAISRAVASLNVLSELCLPYVKKNGFFIAMKSKKVEFEVNESLNAIQKLGGILGKVDDFILEDGSERSIVKIRKINNTPSTYPRQSAKISKKPL